MGPVFNSIPPVRASQRARTHVMASPYGVIALCALFLGTAVGADNPCAARQIEGRSVVCVCNATYCDDVTREIPPSGHYVAYTSSEAGSRFNRSSGEMNSSDESTSRTLELDTSSTHQTVEGFGGAVTDAVGIHFANLSASLQEYFINSYFGPAGLEYNMVRVPIGGSDFSTHAYAYNELPVDDKELSNFTLSSEDFQYKIPLLKRIFKAATSDVHVLGTVWSPPPWMKTNGEFRNGLIKPEYFQTYADYHVKFIREYKKNGIEIWGITTTNEPLNAWTLIVAFQSLGWTPGDMGKWIVENLGPSIRNAADLKHVKILTVDDQRYTIPIWFNAMVSKHPEVLDVIDGVAVHFYGDIVTPAAVFKLITDKYPTKFIIGTEACEGSFPWQKEKVALGDWSRAKNYITDIITDLNYDLVGWIDWNLCLDQQGGPNWAENFVDSPVIVFPEQQEFVKQPMFYAMGHFSKWIPRGSVRVDVTEHKGLLEGSLDKVAFLTPQNTVVLVVYNNGKARNVRVRLGDRQAVLALEKRSITTVEIAP